MYCVICGKTDHVSLIASFLLLRCSIFQGGDAENQLHPDKNQWPTALDLKTNKAYYPIKLEEEQYQQATN